MLSNGPPNPLPPVGAIYAVVQEQSGSVDVDTKDAQIRVRPVLISLYGAAPTAAGKRQMEVLLAWLHKRASDVDRHPGIRVIECRSADDSPVQHDQPTGTHFCHIRYLIRYKQGV